MLQVGGLGGQAGAEAVLLVNAEEDWGPLQHHIPHPRRHWGLQVLLVHQTHDQYGFRQANHQEGHANDKVHPCNTGEV